MTKQAKWQRNGILVLLLPAALFAAQLKLHTDNSLSITKDTYSSLVFTVTASYSTDGQVAYSFTESGQTPPGMIFESYPCNKPNHPPCAAIARVDGIFLDGTPSAAGSYTFEITATDPKGNRARESFTVTVSNRN